MAVEAIIKLLPDSSLRGPSASHIVGLLSVLAISGSVALFTFTAGKRALAAIDDDAGAVSDSDSSETGSSETAGHGSLPPSNAKDCAARRRVHFAEDVKEPCGDSRAYRLRSAQEARAALRSRCRSSSQMPANRLALYKGIRQYRREHALLHLSY